MTRALVHVNRMAKVGEIVDVRATLQHPMETGYRTDNVGRIVPRSIVRRLVATFEGETVFAADLFPAITANPYLAFAFRLSRAGQLTLRWSGDDNFIHTETMRLG
jgi:sulfur-oxidizing protein SoxZ